jgi:hypothetical protein
MTHKIIFLLRFSSEIELSLIVTPLTTALVKKTFTVDVHFQLPKAKLSSPGRIVGKQGETPTVVGN